MINIIYTILCILCLCMGFFYGYRIGKGEKIANPIQEVRKNLETKKVEKQEQRDVDRLNTIWENINNYNGSGEGQREVE